MSAVFSPLVAARSGGPGSTESAAMTDVIFEIGLHEPPSWAVLLLNNGDVSVVDANHHLVARDSLAHVIGSDGEVEVPAYVGRSDVQLPPGRLDMICDVAHMALMSAAQTN